MESNIIDNLSQIVIIFFLFTLVISGNYIGELLPCKIQHILNTNIYIKHLFGYLTILFLVILTLPNIIKKYNILYIPFFGLLCYSFFVIIAKTHYKLWLFVISLMAIIFILSLFKKNLKNEILLNNLKIFERILIFFVIFISLFGIILYYKEKKKEYKKKFSALTFFLGTIGCKNNKSFTYF